MYISNHERSQKRKLLDIVSQLCHCLNRPVSSNDLKTYLTQNPSQRPLLTQRFGQLLIKASRNSPHGIPQLYKCGVWKYHQYYAPDDNQIWRDKFDTFLISQKLQKEVSIQFLDQTRYLLGGKFDSELRNALAGWILEVTPLIQSVPDDLNAKLLHMQVDIAREMAAPTYSLEASLNLLSRPQALQILSEALILRCPHRVDFQVNYNRYLVDISWPQSSLYPAHPSLVYRSEQLWATIAHLWPLESENPEQALALKWMLRY